MMAKQAVDQVAFTIHRLLGFQGHQFQSGPENPIRADVVVIDEFSMVDVPLAWHLFRSIDPEKTAILLVGDHNQLPPSVPATSCVTLSKQASSLASYWIRSYVRQAF